jgi:hypothetical protein
MHYFFFRNFEFSQRCLWGFKSYGVLRRVDWQIVTDVSKSLNLSNIQEVLCLLRLVLLSKVSTVAARLIRVCVLMKHVHVGLSSKAEGNFVQLLLRKILRQFSYVVGRLLLFSQYTGSEIYIYIHTHTHARHNKPGVFPLFCLFKKVLQQLREKFVFYIKYLFRFSAQFCS